MQLNQQTTFAGRAPHDAEPTTARPMLLMVVGAGAVASYPLATGDVRAIGRDPESDIPLAHPLVSRHHAVVRAGANRVLVEDRGSTNGIIVRGERLPTGSVADLRIGESFQLGPYTVVITEPATRGRRGGRDHAAIIVHDPTRLEVPPTIARIAASHANVLVLGETGTGKEVMARTLHELSGRRGAFVGINSAALSESLLESELFGHERGAFTGATQTKPGLLETAPGGTVFLDEIGDLPPALQAKLLRAIEARQVYRVGGLKPIPLDVRFLAATHRDLEAEVAAGRFRADLYYRLNGITVALAPLRERGADAIVRLARTFLREATASAGRAVPALDADALAKLTRYAWPGNVRELRAVVERAILLSDGDHVTAHAILVDVASPPSEPVGFLDVARRCRGNVTAIARELRTSRSHVHRLAQRFGVDLAGLRGE